MMPIVTTAIYLCAKRREVCPLFFVRVNAFTILVYLLLTHLKVYFFILFRVSYLSCAISSFLCYC